MQYFIIDSFNNDDNFLIVLLLMGALFFGLAVIIGAVICILCLLLLIALISAGLISASVLVGYQQKSVNKGFKTFFISASTLGTTIISVIFFRVLNSIYDWWATDTSVIAGIAFGLLSGLLLGWLIFTAFKKILDFLITKYQSFNKK
ncbi:hypothetical protein [Chryseobacterium gossypii]|uniref:hypothetical protein n=1 Tax=Chryseobacterium gossypii TaxID=3231602 RepID=UPI003524701A